MQSINYAVPEETHENSASEEDVYSYFVKLDDVKCSIANIGISHHASELKFFSVRDWPD